MAHRGRMEEVMEVFSEEPENPYGYPSSSHKPRIQPRYPGLMSLRRKYEGYRR